MEPFSWTCPYCNQVATITTANYSKQQHVFGNGSKLGLLNLNTIAIVCLIENVESMLSQPIYIAQSTFNREADFTIPVICYTSGHYGLNQRQNQFRTMYPNRFGMTTRKLALFATLAQKLLQRSHVDASNASFEIFGESAKKGSLMRLMPLTKKSMRELEMHCMRSET